MFGYPPDQLQELAWTYPSDRREEVVQLARTFQPADIPEGDLQQAGFALTVSRANMRARMRYEKERERRGREERFNKGLQQRTRPQIGDQVFIRQPRGVLPAHAGPWRGPFHVTGLAGDHGKTMNLRDVSTQEDLRYPRHAADLRVIRPRPPRLRTESKGSSAVGATDL